jgi:cytochrome c biogenesis protein
VGFNRWISVKVARDPGGVWALAFVGTAILGLSMSLFIRRRRVWVLRGAGDVTVGGVARGERTDLDDELDDIVAELDGQLAGEDPLPQEGVSR